MTKPHASKELKLICLSQKALERILLLRRTGGAGTLLADKVDGIIAKLKSGGICQIGSKIGTRTQQGEKRIRKCVKYDLGYGYRLITVRRGDCLFITYLGTHDECDRWLEENSRIKKVDMGKSAAFRVAPQESRRGTANCEETSEVSDDLEDRLLRLSDQAMRRIFCGLVEARKRAISSKTIKHVNRTFGLSAVQKDITMYPSLDNSQTGRVRADRSSKRDP